MGCDLKAHSDITAKNKVSIHAPVWGATVWVVFTRFSRLFQYTHPCGVRLRSLNKKDLHRVSIHAPVWGATRLTAMSMQSLVFQSTHPCGVRHVMLSIVRCSAVSIHAPVWGATKSCHTKADWKYRFNPRTRVGCDKSSQCQCCD